jgi:hypothetical protein
VGATGGGGLHTAPAGCAQHEPPSAAVRDGASRGCPLGSGPVGTAGEWGEGHPGQTRPARRGVKAAQRRADPGSPRGPERSEDQAAWGGAASGALTQAPARARAWARAFAQTQLEEQAPQRAGAWSEGAPPCRARARMLSIGLTGEAGSGVVRPPSAVKRPNDGGGKRRFPKSSSKARRLRGGERRFPNSTSRARRSGNCAGRRSAALEYLCGVRTQP